MIIIYVSIIEQTHVITNILQKQFQNINKININGIFMKDNATYIFSVYLINMWDYILYKDRYQVV